MNNEMETQFPQSGEPWENKEEKKPAGKKTALLIAVIVVLVAALAVGVFFAVRAVLPGEEQTEVSVSAEAAHHVNAHGYPSWAVHYHTHEGETNLHYSYLNENAEEITLTSDEVNTHMNEVVATCGEMSLDNRVLQYYYNDDLLNFYNTYYDYLGSMLDTSSPLDEQINNNAGTDTWQKTILDMSLTRFNNVAAMKQEAQKNGYQPTAEEQSYLDSMKDLETMAMYYGYTDSLSLIKAMLGPMATEDSYLQYVEDTMIASFYTSKLAEEIEITEEDVSAYYDANAAVYAAQNIQKDDEMVMDVRHILIQPEAAEDGTISDEAWAAAEAEAQRIYDEWKAGEATETTFGDLAEQYSTDTGSSYYGGLYEGVYPGQMVTEFNDWCFDDARQVGDTGIVKTTYGYHIMYYVAQGDYAYWYKLCEDELRNEKVLELRDEVITSYETTLDTAKIILLDAATATTTPSATAETTEE